MGWLDTSAESFCFSQVWVDPRHSLWAGMSCSFSVFLSGCCPSVSSGAVLPGRWAPADSDGPLQQPALQSWAPRPPAGLGCLLWLAREGLFVISLYFLLLSMNNSFWQECWATVLMAKGSTFLVWQIIAYIWKLLTWVEKTMSDNNDICGNGPSEKTSIHFPFKSAPWRWYEGHLPARSTEGLPCRLSAPWGPDTQMPSNKHRAWHMFGVWWTPDGWCTDSRVLTGILLAHLQTLFWRGGCSWACLLLLFYIPPVTVPSDLKGIINNACKKKCWWNWVKWHYG